MSTDTTNALFRKETTLPKGYELVVMPTSEDHSFLSIDPRLPLPPRDNFVILVVEPFSWAAVLKLALTEAKKAIFGAVINAFLDAIFDKKIDLDRLLGDLLVEFAQLVRQILRQEAIEQAYAKTEAIQELMQAYAGRSEFDARLLNSLTVESTKNVSQLRHLGTGAIGAFAIASTVEIVIYLEQFSRSQDGGDWNTVTKKVEKLETHIAKMDRELEKQTKARFMAVSNRWISGRPTGPERISEDIAVYFYEFDGQRYDWFRTIEDAERARANHLVALIRDLKTKIIAPAAALANQAREMVKSKPAPA